jgi:hypothetical protein
MRWKTGLSLELITRRWYKSTKPLQNHENVLHGECYQQLSQHAEVQTLVQDRDFVPGQNDRHESAVDPQSPNQQLAVDLALDQT